MVIIDAGSIARGKNLASTGSVRAENPNRLNLKYSVLEIFEVKLVEVLNLTLVPASSPVAIESHIEVVRGFPT